MKAHGDATTRLSGREKHGKESPAPSGTFWPHLWGAGLSPTDVGRGVPDSDEAEGRGGEGRAATCMGSRWPPSAAAGLRVTAGQTQRRGLGAPLRGPVVLAGAGRNLDRAPASCADARQRDTPGGLGDVFCPCQCVVARLQDGPRSPRVLSLTPVCRLLHILPEVTGCPFKIT